MADDRLEVRTVEKYGTPTARPARGFCPVCQNEWPKETGFCERDWQHECKSHLSSVMHGMISESKGREEPVSILTKQATKITDVRNYDGV